MIETFCILLFIILISRIGEELLRVPATLSLLLIALLISNIFPRFLPLSPGMFDELLLLMLPIVLLPVALSLSLEEIRKNARALLFLALFAVVLSIAVAMYVTPLLLPDYGFSAPMLFALFTMLMATDAATLTSIFTRFRLPERLRMYAEGEGLFNDVTALVLYYVVALPLLSGEEVAPVTVNVTLLKVLFLSLSVGGAAAAAGYLAIKVLKDPLEQFIVIYLVAVVSFLAAEELHVSGILTIIVSIMTLRVFIDRELRARGMALPAGMEDREEAFPLTLVNIIRKVPAMTSKGFRAYRKEAIYIAILANAVLFISIADLVRIDRLLFYGREIVVVFLVTTSIRFLMVNGMRLFFGTPFRWTLMLTFSGVKGGLTIIMVHSLPDGFVYREMFEAVVMGVVLLSAFLYTAGAMAVLHLCRERFKEDRAVSAAGPKVPGQLRKSIRSYLEQDPDTGAYQKVMLEDILLKETGRATRYKSDLSLIVIEFEGRGVSPPPGGEAEWKDFLAHFGGSVRAKIRINDYFCKAEEGRYVVVATNTSAGGAMTLAAHIRSEALRLLRGIGDGDCYLGVTEFAEGDTCDLLMEKVNCSIEKARRSGSGEANLEV